MIRCDILSCEGGWLQRDGKVRTFATPRQRTRDIGSKNVNIGRGIKSSNEDDQGNERFAEPFQAMSKRAREGAWVMVVLEFSVLPDGIGGRPRVQPGVIGLRVRLHSGPGLRVCGAFAEPRSGGFRLLP